MQIANNCFFIDVLFKMLVSLKITLLYKKTIKQLIVIDSFHNEYSIVYAKNKLISLFNS